MREATDLGVSAGVRRELSGRRIDLTKLKFPVKNGAITIEGELSFVGIEKSSDETAIELKFLESSLKAINGAKEITFALTNWTKNEAGVWESIGARPASASTPTASGEGLYCPDCDFVIRFCPCCGKPLAGAGKNAPSKTRRPVPPIKPVIKKKRPAVPFIAPARPVETDKNEAPVIPVAPVKPAVAPAKPVVAPVNPPAAPIKPAPAATPTVSPEPARLEPATPVKPAAPTTSKPVMPTQPAPATPGIPAARPVAPVAPVKPATPAEQAKAPEVTAAPPSPAAPPTIPEDVNKAIDSWNLDPVPLDAEDNEASPFPELFNPEAEKPTPTPVAPQSAPPIAPVRPAAPAMPAKPSAPLPPTEPVAPIMPAAPVAPVPPTDSSMPDLSDFDANAFDLSQAAPTSDSSSTNNSSAEVPNLDQLDISAFVTPEAKEPEAPKADPVFDLGVDLDQAQSGTLTTTPAGLDERCDFPTPNAPSPLNSPFDLDDDTPLPPMKPEAIPASPFDLDDDTPLPPMKPAAPADPFDLDDTPLPPMKPAAPPVAGGFDLDDETPLPPMKPAGQAKPASKDPFAALFTDAGSDLSSPDAAKGKDPFAALDLDLDVLEVFPSNNSEPAPPPAAKPGSPAAAKPVDDNPFNLDNVIDLDSPVEDNKKGQKDPFDLDDFDISKFKI